MLSADELSALLLLLLAATPDPEPSYTPTLPACQMQRMTPLPLHEVRDAQQPCHTCYIIDGKAYSEAVCDASSCQVPSHLLGLSAV